MDNLIFCQSCSMPINDDKLKGTEKDQSLSPDYCVYCYKDGEFTQKDASMQDMIEMSVTPVMENQKISEEEARKQLNQFFPQLKRWAK